MNTFQYDNDIFFCKLTVWCARANAVEMSCESCGSECFRACGTRHFRSCCFKLVFRGWQNNYRLYYNLLKKSHLDYIKLGSVLG